MKSFNKKNKIIITIITILLLFVGVYFVYSKSDDSEIVYFDNGIENENKENNNKEEKTKIEEHNKIIIHISGSVANEGILELDENSRISDAIEKAGGLKEGADLSQINLAYVLSDGIKIHIPNVNENEENKEDKTEIYINKESGVKTILEEEKEVKQDQLKLNQKININNADVKQLSQLPGIGEATAQKIIDYRKENGRFNSIEEIKNVKGIGDNKFEKIKEFVSVH